MKLPGLDEWVFKWPKWKIDTTAATSVGDITSNATATPTTSIISTPTTVTVTTIGSVANYWRWSFKEHRW